MLLSHNEIIQIYWYMKIHVFRVFCVTFDIMYVFFVLLVKYVL